MASILVSTVKQIETQVSIKNNLRVLANVSGDSGYIPTFRDSSDD